MPETPLVPTLPEKQRRQRLRRLASRGVWVGVILAAGFLCWVLWYANNRGFTRKWRGMLAGELERHGLHVQVSRLNLDPLKGLIARNVRVLHPQDRDQTLAYIDEAVLDISYSNLVYGQPFINAIDLREASLSLPIDPDDRKSRRLEVTRLNARLLFPSGGLLIPQADAVIHGLRVSASDCRIINLAGLRSNPPSAEDARRRTQLFLQIEAGIHRLLALNPSGGQPELDLRLHGDLAHPEAFFAEATLRSGAFTFGSPRREITRIEANATYRNQRITLHQCAVSDPHGRLDATGSFLPAKGKGELYLQARSTLHLPALLKAARIPWPGDTIEWEAAPKLEIEGRARLSSRQPVQQQWQGHVQAGPLRWKGVPWRSATLAFALEGQRWFVRDARLEHASGSLLLKALYNDGLRFSLDSRVDPEVLRPLLPERPRVFLDQWQFDTTPVLRFEGTASDATLTTLQGRGHLSIGASRFQGQPLASLVSDVEIKKDGSVEFPGLRVQPATP